MSGPIRTNSPAPLVGLDKTGIPAKGFDKVDGDNIKVFSAFTPIKAPPSSKVDLKSKIKTVLKNSNKGGAKPNEHLIGYVKNGTIPKDYDKKFRHSPQDISLVLVDEEAGVVTAGTAKKKSGYDENFKTAKTSYFKKQDQCLGLNNEAPSFKQGHASLRSRTHSYVHVDKGLITGHIGNVYSDKDFSKTGQQTKGSPGLHKNRQAVIEEVIHDKNISSSDKPVKASIAAAKYLINATVGFKHLEDKTLRWSGHTAAGYDLSNETDKLCAAKSLQAERDKNKLVAIKLGYPEVDITDKDALNESLEEERLTPIRTGTPYSEAVFEYAVEQLKDLSIKEKNGYEAIAAIYSEAVPA